MAEQQRTEEHRTEEPRTEEEIGTGSGSDALPAAAAARRQRDAFAALPAARLRTLRRLCAAMLASVALLAAASLVVGRAPAPAAPVAASTELSLILTALAAALILIASRIQSTILRSGVRGARAALPAAARVGTVTASPPAATLSAQAAVVAGAYARATIVGFALLAAAAALGLAVAAVTGTARYALVICAAAALGMLARWPRRAAVLALLCRSASIGAAG